MGEKEKNIIDQFIQRTYDLAKRTDEEIRSMVNDYVETKKSLKKPPDFWEALEAYDNITISFIRTLIEIRDTYRKLMIQRALAEQERKKAENSDRRQ